MTTIVQVANANELCQEYVRITSMLNMVQSGSYTLYATVSSGTLGNLLGTTAQVTVAQANIITLLQNRQTALANQLASMGITLT